MAERKNTNSVSSRQQLLITGMTNPYFATNVAPASLDTAMKKLGKQSNAQDQGGFNPHLFTLW